MNWLVYMRCCFIQKQKVNLMIFHGLNEFAGMKNG